MAANKRNPFNTTANITFVKLSPHYRAYLHSLYGEGVLRFPVSSPLYAAFEHGLICNPRMRTLSQLACCASLFRLETTQHPHVTDFTPDLKLLTDEAKKDFVAIEMPAVVVRSPSAYMTDSFWQLSYKGAADFRKAVKTEFWIECLRFINACQTEATIKGSTASIENAISDFMMAYQIPMDLYENMLRYYRRSKIELQKQIDEYRTRMENINGVPLCYT